MGKKINRVIIIGTDNHNTLAVIRDLGKHNCDFFVLVHGDLQALSEVKVSKSHFSKGKTFYVEDTQKAIYFWLQNNIEKSDRKTILFPCSDLAAYTIDFYYTELKDHFILPGFDGKPGRVVELMDKYKQKEFAIKHDLPMADTWKIDLENLKQFPSIPFPCILKPEISAKGYKSDIRVCNSEIELTHAINMFVEKGYKEVLAQKFLLKKYEVSSFGCIVDDSDTIDIGGSIKKIREWPIGGGGSMIAGQFIQSIALKQLLNKILHILYLEGYRGQYDFDFLVCNDGIYLNEMNFRHSGNGFGLIDNGVFAPYYYCLSRSGYHLKSNYKLKPIEGSLLLEEISDFKYRREFGLSFKEWFLQFVKASSYSVLNVHDLSGTFAFISERFTNLLKKIV